MELSQQKQIQQQLHQTKVAVMKPLLFDLQILDATGPNELRTTQPSGADSYHDPFRNAGAASNHPR
jgi:hypothetical protein